MDDCEYLYLVGQRARYGSRPAQKLLRELAAKIVPTMATFTRDPDQLERFRLKAGRLLACARR